MPKASYLILQILTPFFNNTTKGEIRGGMRQMQIVDRGTAYSLGIFGFPANRWPNPNHETQLFPRIRE